MPYVRLKTTIILCPKVYYNGKYQLDFASPTIEQSALPYKKLFMAFGPKLTVTLTYDLYFYSECHETMLIILAVLENIQLDTKIIQISQGSADIL